MSTRACVRACVCVCALVSVYLRGCVSSLNFNTGLHLYVCRSYFEQPVFIIYRPVNVAMVIFYKGQEYEHS